MQIKCDYCSANLRINPEYVCIYFGGPIPNDILNVMLALEDLLDKDGETYIDDDGMRHYT